MHAVGEVDDPGHRFELAVRDRARGLEQAEVRFADRFQAGEIGRR